MLIKQSIHTLKLY